MWGEVWFYQHEPELQNCVSLRGRRIVVVFYQSGMLEAQLLLFLWCFSRLHEAQRGEKNKRPSKSWCFFSPPFQIVFVPILVASCCFLISDFFFSLCCRGVHWAKNYHFIPKWWLICTFLSTDKPAKKGSRLLCLIANRQVSFLFFYESCLTENREAAWRPLTMWQWSLFIFLFQFLFFKSTATEFSLNEHGWETAFTLAELQHAS